MGIKPAPLGSWTRTSNRFKVIIVGTDISVIDIAFVIVANKLCPDFHACLYFLPNFPDFTGEKTK